MQGAYIIGKEGGHVYKLSGLAFKSGSYPMLHPSQLGPTILSNDSREDRYVKSLPWLKTLQIKSSGEGDIWQVAVCMVFVVCNFCVFD